MKRSLFMSTVGLIPFLVCLGARAQTSVFSDMILLTDQGDTSARIQLESESGDWAQIYSENEGVNSNRLILRAANDGEDGDQDDYIVLGTHHWSRGDHDTLAVHESKVTVDALLGVGTNSPKTPFHVLGKSTFDGILYLPPAGSTSQKVRLESEVGDWAEMFSENYGPNQNRLVLRAGNDGDEGSGDGDYIVFRNYHYKAGDRDVVSIFRNRVHLDATVSIGSKKIVSGEHTNYQLAVDGKIAAKEVVVTDGPEWADEALEPGYDLMSLDALRIYIAANGHLPQMPTADAVRSDGYSLPEMDSLLLRKIEELTLYVLELEGRLDGCVEERGK